MNMDAMRRRAGAVAALMGQLSNENRLLILCALLERPMTVGELSAQVPHITGPPCPSTSTACGRGGWSRRRSWASTCATPSAIPASPP